MGKFRIINDRDKKWSIDKIKENKERIVFDFLPKLFKKYSILN